MQVRTFATVCSLVLCAIVSPVPVSGAPAMEERAVGRATWFNPGLGACEQVNTDNDAIVALGIGLFDRSLCDKALTITANGKTVSAIVRDACPGCGVNDLDLSPSLFQQLASLDQGVIQISWEFEEASI